MIPRKIVHTNGTTILLILNYTWIFNLPGIRASLRAATSPGAHGHEYRRAETTAAKASGAGCRVGRGVGRGARARSTEAAETSRSAVTAAAVVVVRLGVRRARHSALTCGKTTCIIVQSAFYPRVDVWKGHTRLKSPSRSRTEPYFFIWRMYKAWFSACFFIRACAKSSFAHGVSKMLFFC